MLTWGYDARTSFEDQILPFAKSGYEFFVCPGVNNWSRILPDFGVAMTNIQQLRPRRRQARRSGHAQHGLGRRRRGASTRSNGTPTPGPPNAPGTPPPPPPEVFNRRVGAVLFGEAGDHFGQAVELLAQTHRLPGMKGMINARFWQHDFVPQGNPAAIQSAASNLLAVVRPGLAAPGSLPPGGAVQPARCSTPILFGARRME